MDMPWYDTHCHMACNHAIGLYEGAFACDCMRGMELPPMDLWALLTSPYMKWMLRTVGEDVDGAARQAGHGSAVAWARAEPEKWWSANWRRYERIETQGVSKALARGIRELHHVSLRFTEDTDAVAINEQISYIYTHKGFYRWWREAFDRLHCVRAVKLVEMPYYDRPVAGEKNWQAEKGLVSTALRVDTFTCLGIPPEVRGFRLSPEKIGIHAESLDDYRAQIDRALERALAGGMRALKNASAYFNSLQLPPTDETAASRYVKERKPEDYRAFEAAVLRHLLEWCNARGLPYQMHAGVARIPWCSCENLADQMAAYPNVKFVPLHIYPYVREAGCLARVNANVFLDPCWLSILAPETLRNALREWIGLIPPEKLVYGVDATSIEEWYGGAIVAKEVLGDVLAEKVAAGSLSSDEALREAKSILHDTAQRWYG